MCGCAHHWSFNAPCSCDCPGHAGVRAEMASRAPQLWTGDDGATAYLVTRWPDGTFEVATRPVDGGTRAVWSPPVTLAVTK